MNFPQAGNFNIRPQGQSIHGVFVFHKRGGEVWDSLKAYAPVRRLPSLTPPSILPRGPLDFVISVKSPYICNFGA